VSAAPSFTVVVPTSGGRAGQLGSCLAAIARLRYPAEELELIVANDGAGAEADDVAREFGETVSLRVTQTGGAGPSAARNAGARLARGRFLAFTDDDCRVQPGWLRALEAALEHEPGAAVGGTVLNGADGRCAAASQVVLDAAYAHFNRDPAKPLFFASNNLAFSTQEFRAFGGFDESFLHAEDRELCARWVASGRRLVPAPDAVVHHLREMALPEFWRQHFGYGRGAWAFHHLRAARGGEGVGLEPGFYAELARRVRRHGGSGRVALGALAVVSQLANAAGFGCEALAARLRRRTASPKPSEVSW
jgi:GT2 family glycosyltransferase